MGLLILLAVLPAVVLLVYVYKMDTYEKESPGLLISLLALGALSTLPAGIINTSCIAILDGIFNDNKGTLYYFILTFFVVGINEECWKYLFVYLRTWKNKEFNYKFDGIVYAVFVSLGFAATENITYVLKLGLGNALLRALTAVPGHAIDAVFMGYYYGLAKEQDAWQNKQKAKQYKVLALLVPIFLHGFYDFLALRGNAFLLLLLIVFVIVMDILAVKRVNKSSRENHMIEEKIKCNSCSKFMNSKAFYCGYCGTPLRYKPYDYAQPVQETMAIENMSNMNMQSNSFINEMDNVYDNNMNNGQDFYNDEFRDNYINNINNADYEYQNNYTNNTNNADYGYQNNYINNTDNYNSTHENNNGFYK